MFQQLTGLWYQTRAMVENLRAQIDTYLSHLDDLMRRGRQVRNALTTDPSRKSAVAAARAWQEDCGATVHQLSGGNKGHWLARAFSEAFLMRSPDGHATEGAEPVQIVQRMLDVLQQAVASLSQKDIDSILSASMGVPPSRRFEFVHDPELRPVVEQTYTESRRAFEQGDYDLAMRSCCAILEAIVTDALEHKGLGGLAAVGAPTVEKIADWPFETRLTVAERTGLIRGGCARLPPVARAYREPAQRGPRVRVSERDARLAGQVLHVVMRDLDPSR